ncbi:MAG: FAD-binding protein, partial [Candidatus Omnitrophota bacterium]
MNWPKSLKKRVKLREYLKRYTTFRIGGPAEFFIEPRDISDLKLLLNLLKRDKIHFRVLGAGSNILVSDSGVSGAVLRLNSPYFKKAEFRGSILEAGAGLWLNRLVSLTHKHSLSGLEFLSGIPGTVGGALAMNAG